MDRCEACRYVYTDVPRSDIAGRLRGFGPRYADLLSGRSDADLHIRPAPEVWSPLEYACHIRDVFQAQRDRITLALTHDQPTFESIRRDERAIEHRYNEQDPSQVVNEMADAADALASAFEGLDDAGWLRAGIYTWPTRQARTLEWIGRHTIHEGEHHLIDIARQLEY